ncbi:MAG TPA: peptidoglycan editing factor PgeF [Alphaproteobacteria bacterium]|nr:peptidoglycan editing factor PgeF [Alphaproteobacteria bacterium]
MELLRADSLKELSSVAHGFTTRAWGDCGLAKGAPTENRGRVATALGVQPENLISCYQIHEPTVVTVEKPWVNDDQRPKGDAMVTSVKGIALGIITADCVPLLFADPGAGVIGAAHAGWRGAISGVIENTLDAMEKLGARRQKTYAAIGPCIWQNSYEVGPEFPAPFLAEDPINEKFFRPAFKSDHTMFNLPGYVEAKLRKLGVASIEASPFDTCADPERFYSHRYSTLRKEKREGSLISVIVLSA